MPRVIHKKRGLLCLAPLSHHPSSVFPVQVSSLQVSSPCILTASLPWPGQVWQQPAVTLPQSRRPGPWLPRWSAPRPFKEFSPRQKCILLRQNCIQWPLKTPLSNIEPPALDCDETPAPAQHRTRCAAARLQETESISMLCCWYYLGQMTHSGLMRRTLNNKNTRAQQLVATERY